LRTRTYTLRHGRLRLRDVRLLRRFGSYEDWPQLLDISSDGALVALRLHGALELLDLRTNRLALVAAAPWSGAAFSPDGLRLAYRHRHRLLVRDLRTGGDMLVARSKWGRFEWLQNGRLVFLGDRGTLKLSRPGRAPRPLPRLPRLTDFAFSPSGRRLLYDRRCKTYLLDRRTGTTRRISGHMFLPTEPWAPDGSSFVLQWAEECTPKTGVIWAYHSWDALYAADGRKVAVTGGRDATWSSDSRLLFVYPIQTGSATAGTDAISVIEPRRRHESALLREGNAYNPALIGPGRWVVFAKYDRPDLVPQGDVSGGLYVARLVRR
jgi:hypothetical protein